MSIIYLRPQFVSNVKLYNPLGKLGIFSETEFGIE